jgi:hypothetical protein
MSTKFGTGTPPANQSVAELCRASIVGTIRSITHPVFNGAVEGVDCEKRQKEGSCRGILGDSDEQPLSLEELYTKGEG